MASSRRIGAVTIAWGALGVAAIWIVGIGASPLFAHLNGPQRIGFAYGVGLVWISVMMGVESLLGIPLTPLGGMVGIIGPASGWWAVRVFRRRRRSDVLPGTMRQSVVSRDPLWWGGTGILAVLWLVVLGRALLKPIQFWDAWATYAFKAKVIFLEAAIPSPALFRWGGSANYPDYPLAVSLQEVWVSWFVGTWDDVAVKLLFPGYLLSLLLLAYGSLRERWDARPAMLGTLFVAGLPLVLQHGHGGYTDLPMAYLAFGGAVALTRYVHSTDRRDVILAGVFAAGLVWTRVDGVVLVACNALLLVVLGARRSMLFTATMRTNVSLYLLLPILVWSTWTLVKLHLGVPSTFQTGGSVVPLLERWTSIASVFFRAFFLEGNWLVLWALFVVAASYRWRDAVSEESLFLFWPVIFYLGTTTTLFATTGLFRFLEDGTVAHRLILHVAPIAALWVVHAIGGAWGAERTNKERTPPEVVGA